MAFPIALQLYSIRVEMEKDFAGTLRKVKALGYEGVEFAGLFGNSASEVKNILKEIGLNPISAHVPYNDMISDPKKVIGDYAEIGCKFIAIPHIGPKYRASGADFGEFVEGVKLLGRTARELGMTLLYHNHDFEFEKVNGEYGLDILYSSVSSDLLQTEIDTCWVNVGGENPSEYLRKYTGRSPVVHLKDFIMPGKKPEQMYELIGVEGKAAKEDQKKGFEFRPLGSGEQNFTEILKASKDAGAQWVVIEQDQPSMGKAPMECAEISINYIKSIMK